MTYNSRWVVPNTLNKVLSPFCLLDGLLRYYLFTDPFNKLKSFLAGLLCCIGNIDSHFISFQSIGFVTTLHATLFLILPKRKGWIIPFIIRVIILLWDSNSNLVPFHASITSRAMIVWIGAGTFPDPFMFRLVTMYKSATVQK